MGTGRATSLFKVLRSGQKSESAAFLLRLHNKIYMLCLLYSIISSSSKIKSLVAL
jgi:hypothetical protein